MRGPGRERADASGQAPDRDRDGARALGPVSQLSGGPLPPADDAARRGERARVTVPRGDRDCVRGQSADIHGEGAAVHGRVLVVVVADGGAVAELSFLAQSPALHAACGGQRARLVVARGDRDDPARQAGGDLGHRRVARVHGAPAEDRAGRCDGARGGRIRRHGSHPRAEAGDLGRDEVRDPRAISQLSKVVVAPAHRPVGRRHHARVREAARDGLDAGIEPLDLDGDGIVRRVSVSTRIDGSPAPGAAFRRQRAHVVAARGDRAYDDVTARFAPPGVGRLRLRSDRCFLDDRARLGRERGTLRRGPTRGEHDDRHEPGVDGGRGHALPAALQLPAREVHEH